MNLALAAVCPLLRGRNKGFRGKSKKNLLNVSVLSYSGLTFVNYTPVIQRSKPVEAGTYVINHRSYIVIVVGRGGSARGRFRYAECGLHQSWNSPPG